MALLLGSALPAGAVTRRQVGATPAKVRTAAQRASRSARTAAKAAPSAYVPAPPPASTGAAPVAPAVAASVPTPMVVPAQQGVPPSAVPELAAAPAHIDPARFDRLQAVLDRWTTSASGVESMTVAIRIGGRTWEGSSRQDGGPAPDPQQRYRVMSITKTFTASLVLRAVEAGKLDLDAPLPRIDGVNRPVPAGITIRRLLAHRSGLADYTEAPGYQVDQPMTPERAVELSLAAAPVAPPDTTTRYVNSNYLLLGLLLQQTYHRSFADLVADLTAPIGLPHTLVEPPDRMGWPGFASGGIMSTAGDMALWGEALFTPGRVVSPASLTQMATTGDLEGGLGLWGICPCTDGARGVERFTAIGHFTAAGGMFRFPRSGLTLVMKAEPAAGDTIGRAVTLAQAVMAELNA